MERYSGVTVWQGKPRQGRGMMAFKRDDGRRGESLSMIRSMGFIFLFFFNIYLFQKDMWVLSMVQSINFLI